MTVTQNIELEEQWKGLFLGTPFHTFAPVCVHNREHAQLVREGGQSWKRSNLWRLKRTLCQDIQELNEGIVVHEAELKPRQSHRVQL